MASVAGYLVHAYTASGVVWGFLALLATVRGDYRQALLWLALATAVDATDGWLARLVDITRRAPLIDGARLDDIVDYLTFVIVPAVIVWRAPLVPEAWAVVVPAAMLGSSACGFARRDAKTSDHYFTGFPSYWNIVVVYLLAMHSPPLLNAIAMLMLAVLVFVPVRYIYPSRTPTLMTTTVALCVVWAIQMLAMIWQLPDPRPTLVATAFVFPVYYVALSLLLTARRSEAS